MIETLHEVLLHSLVVHAHVAQVTAAVERLTHASPVGLLCVGCTWMSQLWLRRRLWPASALILLA